MKSAMAEEEAAIAAKLVEVLGVCYGLTRKRVWPRIELHLIDPNARLRVSVHSKIFEGYQKTTNY